jgi:hypothetical protein
MGASEAAHSHDLGSLALFSLGADPIKTVSRNFGDEPQVGVEVFPVGISEAGY